MSKERKEAISITLPASIKERVKIEAEKEERSVSQFIVVVLKKYLKEIDENSNDEKQS